jgi:zinc-binding alcohol dehydrogenase/oxidoreductase
MQALVLRQVKQPLSLEERPPLEPGPDQVVVGLKAAALNRRDYWITQGLYPGIKTPVILGSDGAGVVIRAGENAAEWQDREVVINPGLDWGDRQDVQSKQFHILGMPTDGTFAGEVLVAAAQLAERPSHLTWHQAAALPLGGVTAYRALFTQGRLQAGESLLITGIGGGVATLALQFAVASGARVWVTSSSPEKIEQAVALGAEGGFPYTHGDWARELAKVATPDLILDSAGGEGHAALVELAAPGGRLVHYGATAGPPKKLDLFKIFWKQLQLIGSTMGSPDDFADMLELVARKEIAPQVDGVFPLADGTQALEQMRNSPQFGKLVLEIPEAQ